MYTSNKQYFPLVAMCSVLLSVSAVPQTGSAQVAIEEVVVTALQRDVNLQDTPASVTAFTERQIESAGLGTPADFIALTPGVTMVNAAEYGDTQVNIRGINGTRDAETNYALVVDGVLLTNPNALNQDLVDVEQIEVLKGPQGALYGRNAVAGAIIINTRRPSEEFEARVKFGAGNDSSYMAQALVSGALAPNLTGRFSFSQRETDGHYENTKLNKPNVDSLENTAFNGRLIWDLGESGELDLRLKYSEIQSPSISFNVAVHLSDSAAFLMQPLFNEDVNAHQFRYINNIETQNEQENLNFSLKWDTSLDIGDLSLSFSYNDQENFLLADGSSAAFNLYLSEPGCQASYAEQENNDLLPAPFFYPVAVAGLGTGFFPAFGPTTCDGYQYQSRNQQDYNVELRLNSPEGAELQWQLGFAYNDIEREVVVAQGKDLGMPIIAQAYNGPDSQSPTDQLYDDVFDNTVYALFGQVVYDLSDDLELAAALRWDREERDVRNRVPAERGTLPIADLLLCGAEFFSFLGCGDRDGATKRWINPAFTDDDQTIESRSRSFDQLQPKISLTLKSWENLTLYASYGVGFRSGGFNSQGTRATIESQYSEVPIVNAATFQQVTDSDGNGLTVNLLDDSLLTVGDDYEKEVSKSLEGGFKSRLLDGRLTFNGSIYYTDVEDMQFFNFFAGPFGLLRTINNVDEVTMQGLELDANLVVSESISVYAAASFLDSEIDRNDNRPYTVGNKAPYAPENTFNLGAVFNRALSGGMELTARIDWSYVGDTWFHTVQDELRPNFFTRFSFGRGDFSNAQREAYDTTNIRVALSGEQWELAVYGYNITDESYLEESIPAPEFGGSFIHNGPADSYGVELVWDF